MFANFSDLSICLYKHNTLVSKELLTIIINHLDGVTKIKDFVAQLYIDTEKIKKTPLGSELGFINVSSLKPKFTGNEGAIFLNEKKTTVTKVFRNRKKSSNLNFDDCDTIEMFIDVIANYLLIKCILKEAYAREYTNSDLSVYFHDIDAIHCLKGTANVLAYSEEKKEFIIPKFIQLHAVSKYHKTTWSQEHSAKSTVVARDIINLLIKIDKFAVDHGVIISHGDLKLLNIVYDEETESTKIIDLGFSTVMVNFDDEVRIFNWEKVINGYGRFLDLYFFAFEYFWRLKHKQIEKFDEDTVMKFFEGCIPKELCLEYKKLNCSTKNTNDFRYGFFNNSLPKILKGKQDMDFVKLAKKLNSKMW